MDDVAISNFLIYSETRLPRFPRDDSHSGFRQALKISSGFLRKVSSDQ